MGQSRRLLTRSAQEGRTVLIGLAALALILHTTNLSAQEELPWQADPGVKAIGRSAEIDLPEGYLFLDAAGTEQFMTMSQNPVSGSELATVYFSDEKASWFLLFDWDAVGYVSDSDADKLDADALLESIRDGTEEANKERESKGWPALKLVGWHEKPRYDPVSHNLTWAIIGESENERNINRNTRLLGRHGVMSAVLVVDTENLESATRAVDKLLAGFRYRTGSGYAEFIPGTDKVAEYGLVALVAGGAGAALVKSGLLAKLWKPIVISVTAALAALGRMISGRNKTST